MPQSALATARQRETEERAIAVFNSQQVRRARAETLRHFQADRNASLPHQDSLIQQSVEEHYFHPALMAVSETPDDPTLIWTLAHDHQWMGLEVPGSRFGQDNSDNCYRLAVIDLARSYRITGKFADVPSCDFSICALAGQPGERMLADTTAVITRDQIDVHADGTFHIAVDAGASAGRRNHLSIARAKTLMVRDTLADWAVEMPASLEIQCLDPRPIASFDLNAAVQRAATLGDCIARYMLEVLQHGIFERGPLNTMNPPWSAGDHGGLPTQASSLGHYRLERDQALIITADRLDAKYLGMQITDVWMLSYEYRHRASSLNHTQATPDRDGRFRWVISPSDPGVPNWLDSGGHGCGTILLRWQGLQPGRVPTASSMTCELTSLADVRARLPEETLHIGPQERAARAAKRLLDYEQRIR